MTNRTKRSRSARRSHGMRRDVIHIQLRADTRRNEKKAEAATAEAETDALFDVTSAFELAEAEGREHRERVERELEHVAVEREVTHLDAPTDVTESGVFPRETPEGLER